MATVLQNAGTGDTGSHTAAGVTEMLASGVFNGAKISVTARTGTLDPAPAYTFPAAGAVSLAAAAGTILDVEVIGGDNPSIDLSANP